MFSHESKCSNYAVTLQQWKTSASMMNHFVKVIQITKIDITVTLTRICVKWRTRFVFCVNDQVKSTIRTLSAQTTETTRIDVRLKAKTIIAIAHT